MNDVTSSSKSALPSLVLPTVLRCVHRASRSEAPRLTSIAEQWLREWDVDIASGRPITLMKLVMREWKTGKILNEYSLEDYEKTWGNVSCCRFKPSLETALTCRTAQVYNMFHRVDMHEMLLRTATQEAGEGVPCSVVVDHIAKDLDAEKGTVTFENGVTIQADLILGADGIRVSRQISAWCSS